MCSAAGCHNKKLGVGEKRVLVRAICRKRSAVVKTKPASMRTCIGTRVACVHAMCVPSTGPNAITPPTKGILTSPTCKPLRRPHRMNQGRQLGMIADNTKNRTVRRPTMRAPAAVQAQTLAQRGNAT